MKKYIFKVLVCTGAFFTTSGMGYNVDDALMDACDKMAKECNYPEDDIEDVQFVKVDDSKA